MTKRGVLVMAYGTPAGLNDVERYYTDIRRGRAPSAELLEELTDRYRAIGGRSPLLEITRAQVAGLEERLDGVRAYLGQKHSSPFIADAMEEVARDGIEELVGLVLAPHFSALSVGDYERRARAGAGAERATWSGRFQMVQSWHLEPGYVSLLAERVRHELDALPPELKDEALVVFSAHSLPERILAEDDPYADQLRETAAAVASRLALPRWRTGWQSAGRTADPWLGPDILEIVEKEAAEGTRALVVCPCGFVADHLEVLYDLDTEAADAAARVDITLRRTRSPNADPEFLDVLASVVRPALSTS
jgi:ferrochelatase